MYPLGLLLLLLLTSLGLSGCGEPARPTVNLDRAVDIGDLDQLRRHLYWGTDINRPNTDGNYPLHVAANAGRVTIARELVRSGAHLDARDSSDRTPLETALYHGRTRVAEMLVRQGAALDPQAMLFSLIRQGVSGRDSLDFLTRRGADLDALDEDGLAPLHRAIEQGRLEQATRLIRAGVDINLPDREGRTPLAIAQTKGQRGIIALLKQYGARS
ncbi:ankyrin repeat domain-containing protein [Thioalkalicoccus limnaeus]|uniref:Ankyrin repeat domain-containing protein n=1 Tax=Thioalkalicoccus limnaeus TaxID=120681 RepID=A0ABV4B9U5_9GAMM